MNNSRSSTNLGGTLIENRFLLQSRIGQGSFGEIYEGIDKYTMELVAVKLERCDTKYPQLLYESRVYAEMTPYMGLPNIRYYGKAGSSYNCLVMDRLGESLEQLYERCGRRFSLKTILMLAVQMLDRIKYQHDKHYLHRDIKPDNFLMGVDGRSHLVYLIDMGLSKKYINARGEHIPFRDRKKLTGTPRYASVSTHQGIEQCRRDDLESMGYMLVYFMKGRLPWQGLKAKTKQEKYDKIGQEKMNCRIDDLCSGCPKEFSDFLHYTRNLQFSEKPDYSYLRSLFSTLFSKSGFTEDWMFDWMLTPKPVGISESPTHCLPSQTLQTMMQKNYRDLAVKCNQLMERNQELENEKSRLRSFVDSSKKKMEDKIHVIKSLKQAAQVFTKQSKALTMRLRAYKESGILSADQYEELSSYIPTSVFCPEKGKLDVLLDGQLPNIEEGIDYKMSSKRKVNSDVELEDRQSKKGSKQMKVENKVDMPSLTNGASNILATKNAILKETKVPKKLDRLSPPLPEEIVDPRTNLAHYIEIRKTLKLDPKQPITIFQRDGCTLVRHGLFYSMRVEDQLPPSDTESKHHHGESSERRSVRSKKVPTRFVQEIES